MIAYSVFPSPLQALLLSADESGLTGVYMDAHKDDPMIGADWVLDEHCAVLVETKRQLTAYFGGELTQFDLPLAPQGSEFQKRVWQELTTIAYGHTLSYGELARQIGNPNASRAVGLANGRNPISIIIPCHRVIGANGQLTGYGGGLPRKRALLAFESAILAQGAQPFPPIEEVEVQLVLPL